MWFRVPPYIQTWGQSKYVHVQQLCQGFDIIKLLITEIIYILTDLHFEVSIEEKT